MGLIGSEFEALAVGLLLEGAFFSIFVATYGVGTWLLFRGDQLPHVRRRNRILFIASTLMLMLSIVHMGFSVYFISLYTALVATKDPDVPKLRSITTAQYLLYVTQGLIGDGFMLYRLHVVWGQRWKITFVPAIMFFANGVVSYVIAGLGTFPSAAAIFYIFSFFTNVVTSLLIAGRILLHDAVAIVHPSWSLRERACFNAARHRRVFEAIVESAGIFTLASVTLLITRFVSPKLGYLACMTAMSPLIGFVFSLVVVHVARGSVDASASSTSATAESEPQFTTFASTLDSLETVRAVKFP
ncbi:uncharacterized protein BXZ73DRAFT_105774 [Epithele typhae]|uniref:uncharacterized protein n=1 Tax=Epithele typhae TaxID=378194 RepID=UPI002008909E|nr:uncharacterized protein BXZ73DRAFT_105774 [Epithele typhae]KAH9916581.1 hypothetical protein BXZ73DRAFT_105774 [Epithele typhae]